MSTDSTYRRIISSTAVFGGAQLLNIVVNVIRGKLVATILHSHGMGIMSLLSNASNSIQQIALMGLNVSSVRTISQAQESNDLQLLETSVRIVRILVLGASLLGLLFTLLFSPWLSAVTFGSSDYTPFFLLLSLAVFFNVMSSGEMAVMQGLRRYKSIAFCSTIPPVCGLLMGIPIYYFWGVNGIVPAMIVMSAVYYAAIRLQSYRGHRHAHRRITLRLLWAHGKDILQLGFVLAIGSLLGTLTTYALSAFISNVGSIPDVGFYHAANTITMQFVSIVFTAMATDYYPHLASLIKDKWDDALHLVNQQAEMALLVVTPMVMLMMLTAPLLISILLTGEFLTIQGLVRFFGLAGFFKALCFPMDYIAFAKGDKHYIFWVETVWSNLKTLAVMATFYYLMGLEGLGYGVLLSAVIDAIVTLLLTRWRYGFMLSAQCRRLVVMLLLMALFCFAATFIPSLVGSYAVMALLTVACMIFAYRQFNMRVDVRSLLSRIHNPFAGKK